MVKLWVREALFMLGLLKLKEHKPRTIRVAHMGNTCLKVYLTQEKATGHVLRPFFGSTESIYT